MSTSMPRSPPNASAAIFTTACACCVSSNLLWERGGDIILLAEHILAGIRAQSPETINGSPAAIRALGAHGWPGNVRELINRIRHAAAMCEDGMIQPAD